MIKTIFTLTVDNYSPEIRKLTLPLLNKYANKIGANIYEITERKFPEFPPVYEKFQIYELAKSLKSDWNIFVDADALIHPETIDFTIHMPPNTVGNHKCDMANMRFKYDEYFIRDGRNIGCGGWFSIVPLSCIDFWKPLTDLNPQEAYNNIYPTINEKNAGINSEHLIDDYVTSRNVARYGLKYRSTSKILEDVGFKPDAEFFYHEYCIGEEEKMMKLENMLVRWGVKN